MQEPCQRCSEASTLRQYWYLIWFVFSFFWWFIFGLNLPKLTINTVWTFQDHYWVKLSGFIVFLVWLFSIFPFSYCYKKYREKIIDNEGTKMSIGIITAWAIIIIISVLLIPDIDIKQNPIATLYILISRLLYSLPIAFYLYVSFMLLLNDIAENNRNNIVSG